MCQRGYGELRTLPYFGGNSQEQRRDLRGSTEQADGAGARRYPRRNTPDQQDFNVAISNGNTLTVELLDGGVCLDNGDNEEDDIIVNRRRLQQAIEQVIQSNSSSINKLDLYASHFRANLTAKMIGSILKVLPPLEHLQLGGARLSVEELCLVLGQPELAETTHLALYDLEFTNNNNNNNNHHIQINDSLALQEVVAVFLRLENDQVTLDPLFETLQCATKLRQLELVLDHNHAYVHGFPRTDQHVHHPQQQLFSALSFADMLHATQNSLSNIVLEYVPLTAKHFEALTEHGKSVKQLRLRGDPSEATGAISENGCSDKAFEALKGFLLPQKCPVSLQTLSVDGMVSQAQHAKELCQVLAYNQSIQSLRLRSIPFQLNDLATLLSNNTTLHHLALHNIDFESHRGNVISVAPSSHDLQPEVMEKAVFTRLVKILKDDNNTTLRRISWKQAEFKRTEVFPRRRKAKMYKCYQPRPHTTTTSSSQQQQQPSAQEQLHWYLTLNKRGIRNVMVDANLSLNEFMIVLERQGRTTMQQAPSLQSQDRQKMESKTRTSVSSSEDEMQDEYSLDCLYYLMSNNPSLCSQ